MDFQILLALVGLLVTILIAIGEKRVLAWFIAVTLTLILPNAVLTLGAMQLSAVLLAPTTTDVASFVAKIAWSVGIFSGVYPLIWGVKFYPRLKDWVSGISSSGDEGNRRPPDKTKRR